MRLILWILVKRAFFHKLIQVRLTRQAQSWIPARLRGQHQSSMAVHDHRWRRAESPSRLRPARPRFEVCGYRNAFNGLRECSAAPGRPPPPPKRTAWRSGVCWSTRSGARSASVACWRRPDWSHRAPRDRDLIIRPPAGAASHRRKNSSIRSFAAQTF